MDVYVLKDGRRIGPFLPFKLREMLEEGEISSEDQGWLEGMEAWAPLESMEPLAGWMPRKPGAPPPLPREDEWAAKLTALRPQPDDESRGWTRAGRAFQRWAARLTDATLWFALVWAVGVKAGWLSVWAWMPDLNGMLLCLLPPLLWLPVEATLLHWLGTTPGKWFMGIRVTDELGQKLSWPAALKRSALVHVTGNGLGLPINKVLPILQWSMAWMFYRRTGTTLWDRGGRSQIQHTGVPAAGVIAIVLTGIGWFSVATYLLFQAPLPPNLPDEARLVLEENRRQLNEILKEVRKREQEQQQQQQPASSPNTAAPPAGGGKASEKAGTVAPDNPPPPALGK